MFIPSTALTQYFRCLIGAANMPVRKGGRTAWIEGNPALDTEQREQHLTCWWPQGLWHSHPRKLWGLKSYVLYSFLDTMIHDSQNHDYFEMPRRKDTFKMPSSSSCRRLLLLLLSCFSRVRFCATPQMAALGFSRQEHWSGMPPLL